MSDGVLLLDKDFRYRFGNQQFMRSLRLVPEVTQVGLSCEEIIRFQAERGDFGPVDDVGGGRGGAVLRAVARRQLTRGLTGLLE